MLLNNVSSFTDDGGDDDDEDDNAAPAAVVVAFALPPALVGVCDCDSRLCRPTPVLSLAPVERAELGGSIFSCSIAWTSSVWPR